MKNFTAQNGNKKFLTHQHFLEFLQKNLFGSLDISKPVQNLMKMLNKELGKQT
jgi:hypothetical protein